MEEVDYCRDPKDVRLLPGVPEMLRELKARGFLNIIITNQAGIGRGIFTGEDYHRVHAELIRQIGDGLIDGTYFCPDAPWAASDRRKPGTGMVEEAARDFSIDLARSFFVGDKESDILCGKNAGTKTVLVQTGYGSGVGGVAPDFVAKDVVEAARFILKTSDA